MYQILIKNKETYKQYMVQEEIMKDVETEDADGNITVTQEGTGQFKLVPYSTEDKNELEATCIELLKKYNTEQVLPYENLTYVLDLVWN